MEVNFNICGPSGLAAVEGINSPAVPPQDLRELTAFGMDDPENYCEVEEVASAYLLNNPALRAHLGANGRTARNPPHGFLTEQQFRLQPETL